MTGHYLLECFKLQFFFWTLVEALPNARWIVSPKRKPARVRGVFLTSVIK